MMKNRRRMGSSLGRRGDLKYYLFHKPFGVLCQFTSSEGRETLARFGPFPSDMYPVGRLDVDSEGLLLLTNDGTLKHLLLEPRYGHPRTYLAQVEGVPPVEALSALEKGVLIEGRMTRRAEAVLLREEPLLAPRSVPIRYRKNIPTSWLRLMLYEGRNRQVRKMTAAVGHPTLRLIRVALGPLELGRLKPGEMRRLSGEEVKRLYGSLKLRNKP